MRYVCSIGDRDPKYDPRPAVDPLVQYLRSLPFSYSDDRQMKRQSAWKTEKASVGLGRYGGSMV